MSIEELFETTPVDREAEERAWRVVREAHAAREPQRRPYRRYGLALAAAGAALAAAAFSPPGRAVVNDIRRSIGIANATPALFRLPAEGRLLVSGKGGTWVVAADGSKRRLGAYAQASWSPHGLFVAGVRTNELAAVAPDGTVRWTLVRPHVRFPRWAGLNGDTRIAYLTTSRLHVVAGDGTGDIDALGLPAAAGVAPAWRPVGNGHRQLAYVTARGRVIVLNPDRGNVTWESPGYAGPQALAWSPDGKTLALAARTKVVLFAGATGRTRTLRVEGVRALAFSAAGRLALERGQSLLLVSGTRLRTLFAAPATLAGLAWSPDGRWLLTALPAADQWVFVEARDGHRVLAVSHVRRQFGGQAVLDGWLPGAS
ncbi:MAG: WD40 repeat domain-containing protein [Gaiellaceae bacterium]